jgi:hypothetical protein
VNADIRCLKVGGTIMRGPNWQQHKIDIFVSPFEKTNHNYFESETLAVRKRGLQLSF